MKDTSIFEKWISFYLSLLLFGYKFHFNIFSLTQSNPQIVLI
jgi:hypothetical protein